MDRIGQLRCNGVEPDLLGCTGFSPPSNSALPSASDRVAGDPLDRGYLYASDSGTRVLGLDDAKDRLTKEAMMRLKPSSLEDWSRRHFKTVIPALQFFQRRPPLFILAGDVGTGKTELGETLGDAVSRKAGIPILLHSLSLTARGTGAVGEMTRRISAAFGMIKSQAG